MANLSENYGLDFLMEDDTAMGFVGYLAKEGKGVTGYYGYPYLFTPLGNVEYWVKTEKNDEGNLEVKGIDSHCGGNCIWDMVCSGIDITPKDSAKLEKVLMLNRANGSGGLLPIDLITADVLPSFMKGDKVTAQVIGLPLDINYYADEDEYTADQPADENGKKWMVGNGALMPLSFLVNHNPEKYEQGKDYDSDAYVHFTATVTKLYHGVFELNGDKNNTFIRCFVDTEYGPLELDHTIDQVPENQRANLKVGAIVSGICLLSGDVAINEYENGAVKDFQHDLMLLRYTFTKGDPERLRSILTDDTVYSTETSGKDFHGADSIIDKIKYVQENRKNEYFAHLATITAVDEELEYPVGTRCVVLAAGEEDNYESIAFINVGQDGMIERIKISTDGRYHFKVDEPVKVQSLFDDIEIPESVVEPIILRAKFHGLIDEDYDPSVISNEMDDYYYFEDNAQKMLDALTENPQPDVEETFANIFGYLFAKAIEQAYNEEYAPKVNWRLTASYCPDDAFHGVITSTFDEKKHRKLEKALELGKQFFNDFSGYMEMSGVGEEHFVETIKLALVTVQWIGQKYKDNCFKERGE